MQTYLHSFFCFHDRPETGLELCLTIASKYDHSESTVQQSKMDFDNQQIRELYLYLSEESDGLYSKYGKSD